MPTNIKEEINDIIESHNNNSMKSEEIIFEM